MSSSAGNSAIRYARGVEAMMSDGSSRDGRIRFADLANTSSRAEYDRTIALIDAWWAEFAQRTHDLSALFRQEKEWDLPAFMARHLQAINPDLMWEYGPSLSGDGHRLVITPESAKHLRPLVTTLLERAPRLPGWEFYGYRLPENAEMAQVTVEARTQGDLSGVEVRARRGEHNARTPNLPLWKATHSASPFYDERFSKTGETFAYVKLDGSQGVDTELFADKAEIEDAIDAALKPTSLGCQIGGGTGLRYSYIDLALTNVGEAIRVVCERLRAGNVRVYPDSPLPPTSSADG